MKYKIIRNVDYWEHISYQDPQEFRTCNVAGKFETSDINLAYRFIEYLTIFYAKDNRNYTWKIEEVE